MGLLSNFEAIFSYFHGEDKSCFGSYSFLISGRNTSVAGGHVRKTGQSLKSDSGSHWQDSSEEVGDEVLVDLVVGLASLSEHIGAGY